MVKKQDTTIFEAYKPLCNVIRKLDLTDSLAVIRAYLCNLQFDHDIPSDYEVDREYLSRRSHAERVSLISEFHLETLCREVILHASDLGRAEKSLKEWATLGKAINHLKKLEEVIAGRYETTDLFLQELHRMAHRQFPWQESRTTAANITRYHMIYGHPPLKEIINGTIGISLDKLFLFGIALLGTFFQKFALFYQPNIQIPGLSQDGLDRFLRHFSRNVHDLRILLQNEQEMNDRFLYAYHSLRAFPLIKTKYQGKDSLIWPLPTLLFWRFTNGVYYEICKKSGFDSAFGDAFQWYVGQVIERGTQRESTRFYPETQYWVGKDSKRTVDWIVAQDGAAIFVEAKTKRLAHQAKVEIIEEDILPLELDKLAAMVVRVYKSIRDHKAGHYPHFPFDPSRKIYPIIVTLEDWFLMGPKLVNKLRTDVARRLEDEGIPIDVLEEMPFSVCAIHEFEQAIQVMDHAGIRRVMQGKVERARQDWTLAAYLRDGFQEHREHTRFLFEEEFESIVSGLLGDLNLMDNNTRSSRGDSSPGGVGLKYYYSDQSSDLKNLFISSSKN
jgi:hypothetical protein